MKKRFDFFKLYNKLESKHRKIFFNFSKYAQGGKLAHKNVKCK